MTIRRLVLTALLVLSVSFGTAGAGEVLPIAPGEIPHNVHLPLDFLDKPVLPLRTTEDWDREEKLLMWSYVALSAVDAYQTVRQPEGSVEANPLVSSWAGERPSVREVLLFKAAATYGLLRLADRIPSARGKRKLALGLLNTLQLTVDVHNERVTGGILLRGSK